MTMTEIRPAKTESFLRKPVDIASLAVFRILFGSLLFFSVLRFISRGWVKEFYVDPTFYFTYYGFSWIHPWPAWGMYLHFALLALAALCIALGCFYRAATFAFFLLFTYVELLDKTNYLNHYYFLSLITLLMTFLPLHRAASLDVLRKPSLKSDTVPAWVLWILRLQVGLVYFFGGLAKVKSDWVFHAQPLRIWLGARGDFPVLGSLFHEPWIAYAMSWAGLFFDLTVPFWLLWKRSRPFAYAAVVFFHLMTVKLFYIGMFPWIMIVAAMVFFSPDWPRRWLPRSVLGFLGLAERASSAPEAPSPSPFAKAGAVLAAAFFLLQFLIPLRHFLYPGNMAWTEEGFRFSWNVMLIEKNGSVEFEVRNPDTGRTWQVRPRDYLKPQQAKMMSTQPDMILAFAHHLADVFRQQGNEKIEVRAQAFASLNGRPARPLIDPTVDLAKEKDSFAHKTWILPLPERSPP